MHNRIPWTLALALTMAGTALTACHRGASSGTLADLTQTRTELEQTRQKLADTEKKLAATQRQVEQMTVDADLSKKQLSDKEVLSIQKDNQIKALQTQINERRDAMIYAEISATHERGLASIALDRYRQFVIDYPKSPLITDANRAINDLAVKVDRESQARAALIDPKRREKEALKSFKEGVATVEEISPLVRQRSAAEVVKILGAPNRTYRNGTEIGYVDRVIDPTTGNRDTLVIIFESDRAVSLRVGYRGREIKL